MDNHSTPILSSVYVLANELKSKQYAQDTAAGIQTLADALKSSGELQKGSSRFGGL